MFSLAEILQGMGLLSKRSTIDVYKTIGGGVYIVSPSSTLSSVTGTIKAPSGTGYLIDKITFCKARDTAGNQVITDELYVEFTHKRVRRQGRMETFRIYALESAYDYEHKLLALLSKDDELKYNFVNTSDTTLMWGFSLHVYSYPIENEPKILKFLRNPCMFLLGDLMKSLEEIKRLLKGRELPEVEVVKKKVPVKRVEIPVKGIGVEL